MRLFILLLSCLLATGSIVVAIADYLHVPVESPKGLSLGRFYLLDDVQSVESARLQIGKSGFGEAAKVWDAALQRDPGSAYRWCDAGEALLNTGHPEQAERCYRRAAELAPKDVRILLFIGDFYSTINKPELAIKSFSLLLSETGAPKGDILTANVFGYYGNMNLSRNHLLDQAIPDQPNASAYLRYVMQAGDETAVQEVWDWASRRHFDDDGMTLEFTGFMYHKQRYEAAARAWEHHFAPRNDGFPRSSRVFNGGFEDEITNGVFDWQFGTPQGVVAVRDQQIHQSGLYSYRFDFNTGDNFDFHHLRQTVYVLPGRYRFEAWMRTANITSDQGIRFRLRASNDRSPGGVVTEALTGTREWTRIEADIDVPSGVPLMEITLVRHPSFRVANQLSGSVWIDSVKLTPR